MNHGRLPRRPVQGLQTAGALPKGGGAQADAPKAAQSKFHRVDKGLTEGRPSGMARVSRRPPTSWCRRHPPAAWRTGPGLRLPRVMRFLCVAGGLWMVGMVQGVIVVGTAGRWHGRRHPAAAQRAPPIPDGCGCRARRRRGCPAPRPRRRSGRGPRRGPLVPPAPRRWVPRNLTGASLGPVQTRGVGITARHTDGPSEAKSMVVPRLIKARPMMNDLAARTACSNAEPQSPCAVATHRTSVRPSGRPKATRRAQLPPGLAYQLPEAHLGNDGAEGRHGRRRLAFGLQLLRMALPDLDLVGGLGSPVPSQTQQRARASGCFVRGPRLPEGREAPALPSSRRIRTSAQRIRGCQYFACMSAMRFGNADGKLAGARSKQETATTGGEVSRAAGRWRVRAARWRWCRRPDSVGVQVRHEAVHDLLGVAVLQQRRVQGRARQRRLPAGVA